MAVGAGIGAGYAAATYGAAKFDAQMRRNLTMMSLGVDRLDEMKAATRRVAADRYLTTMPTELAKAGYRVATWASDNVAAYESVLRESARLAEAGDADAEATANTQVRLMRAYRLSAAGVHDLSESMMMLTRQALPRLGRSARLRGIAGGVRHYPGRMAAGTRREAGA
jgi:hypothetical protein